MSIVDIPGVSTPGVGYVFTGPYIGRVDLGVAVISSGDDAIVNNDLFLGATLDNFGYVSSTWNLGNGVFFGANASLGHIINEVSGTISGGWSGVVAGGILDTIDNLGNIIGGFDGITIDNAAAGTAINNYGYISGGQYAGVEVNSQTHGDESNIRNTGTITGGGGIIVDTTEDSTTNITNDSGGLIEGSGYGIEIKHGAISLVNHGTINNGINDDHVSGNNGINNDGMIGGGITFGGGVNALYNAGSISGGITFGNGENVITNVGVITGGIILGDGNNSYDGKGGQVDQITCGNGGDGITLGQGNTTVLLANGYYDVTAGSGHDTFWFTSHHNIDADKISGFSSGLDHITLSKAGFSHIMSHQGVLAAADFHIGRHAMTNSQHIIYNAHNGFLFYDPDGSGPAHEVHFATMNPHLHLTAHDFLVSA